MKIIKHEGLFRLYDKNSSVILTDEKQLDRIIADSHAPLFVDDDLGYSGERTKLHENDETLYSLCEAAQKRGCTRMEVSYDFFFGGSTRHNYPSDETTVKAFKVVHDVAREHGMGFGASILSPLDVGGGWAKISDETGFSYQFMETEIQENGSYRADMVCQRQWYNNKGPIQLVPVKVLVYAFSEQRVGNTHYFAVDPNAIIDISDTAAYTIEEESSTVSSSGYGSCPMSVYGTWAKPSCNRALCIMVYRTPELDYFAPSAPAFMKQLLDQHNAAGISYAGFYSDEMHIQFDWDLVAHFGEKEITTRYLTPHLAEKYAALYGERYHDFAKYLIYMSYHQHDFLSGDAGKENAQHVFGPTAKDIYDTWQFRNRYFELLQRTVVDLCNDAKAYAEQLWGAPIMTRAHATWQESPTCDHYYKKANFIGGFNTQELLGDQYAGIDAKSPVERRAALEKAKAAEAAKLGISRYDYTPWYDWSSSIRENISACYDYFKWNEFLSGGGTDHPEGGNLDRNYYAQALAASFGELNPFEMAYCAGWGMPNKVGTLFRNVGSAYGNAPWDLGGFSFVHSAGSRRTDVLALYPIKLNNVEERFGSWMVQYGYCNYITEEKLLQNATLTGHGTLCINGQEFTTLVAMFEPFLSLRTMQLLEDFLSGGGKVLWMSVPPALDADGGALLSRFQELFGLQTLCEPAFAEQHKGEEVTFTGSFSGIQNMPVLNDYLVDYIYPCTPTADAEAIAMLGGQCVAVRKAFAGGGLAVYAGFRVRDDQSCSLGKDIDTLFAVLMKMGAYRPGSLEARSRQPGARYLMNLFADGSISAAPHYRTFYEAWEGTFFRDEDYDNAVLEGRTLPSEEIILNEEIDGHTIGYRGSEYVSYRLNADGVPVAFCGTDTTGITVDGTVYAFTDKKAKFEFAPVPARFYESGISSLTMASCATADVTLRFPVCGKGEPQVSLVTDNLYETASAVPFQFDGTHITLQIDEALVDKHIAVIFLG